MLKKLFIAGGATFLVLLLLFGRSTLSYLRTSAGYISDAAQESVPVEFQIDRARGMIKDLVPEVRKNMQVIAKEEVEIKKLEEQIAQTETRLAKEKEHLLRLKNDLAGGQSSYTYNNRTYTAEQVKADMANRFARYKTGEATLASLEQMLAARQRSLDAARQKLEGMLAAKRQLAVEVENLEARQQMVAAAQATSAYQFDDSRLGQAKELIAKLRTRLDVAEKLANAETTYQGEIQLEGATPENIVEQVTEHFAADRATKLASATQK